MGFDDRKHHGSHVHHGDRTQDGDLHQRRHQIRRKSSATVGVLQTSQTLRSHSGEMRTLQHDQGHVSDLSPGKDAHARDGGGPPVRSEILTSVASLGGRSDARIYHGHHDYVMRVLSDAPE